MAAIQAILMKRTGDSITRYMADQQGHKKRYQVLIVDDHPVVRKGLSLLVEQTADLAICAESEDVDQVNQLVASCRPDAIILDLSFKEGSGLDAIKDLKGSHPNLPVLVFSVSEAEHYAERAIRAGALGFVNKGEDWREVLTALREILKGNVYASEDVKNRLLRRISKTPVNKKDGILDLLSDREIEMFQMLGQGYSTREIAKKWRRSVKTVETYRANIKRKLNLSNSVDLIREAVLRFKPSR